MSKKKDKSIVSLNITEDHLGLFAQYLNNNNLAVDEIIIHVTNMKTGKHKKIKLIKTFGKLVKKVHKKLKKDSSGEYKNKFLGGMSKENIITKNEDGIFKINNKKEI